MTPLRAVEFNSSVTAFMDDTVWIAKSKNELQQILQITESFMQYANIKVNPNKSVLLTNDNTDHAAIDFMGTTISNLPLKTTF